MNDFVPYDKLSKKAKRELDSKKRRSWNGLNPATRIADTDKKKKYSRKEKHPERLM